MPFYENFTERSGTSFRQKIQISYYRKVFDRYGIGLSGKKFLEVGPGAGLIADLVVQENGEYRGIEGTNHLASTLRERGFNITEGYCPPIPFEENSFDIVFSSHVLEHMSGPQDAYEFFAECRRVLKPDGQLITIAPDASRMGKFFWDCDYTHVFPVTGRRLSQLLTDAGFSRNRIDEVVEPVLGPMSLFPRLFLLLYPYKFLESLAFSAKLKVLVYKLRSTFAECVIAVSS